MAGGHGGARSGAGRKPGQKNKATEKAKATLAELAKAHTQTAIDTIVDLMMNGETGSVRLGAANAILDRGYGRPMQANIEVKPEDFPHVFDGWHIERAKPDQDNAD